MKAIKRVYLSEQVLESVLKYIQDHNLTVGDKIPTEGEFAELFQVSRTSVREAIKALSINGAVESIPGKGTFLRAPYTEVMLNRSGGLDQIIKAQNSITEIIEVRTALEVLAIELAIDRASDEAIELVAEAMEGLREVIDKGERWAEAGTRFHSCIAEITGNTFLVDAIKSLNETITRYKNALNNAETRMGIYIEEHQNILDALRARDKKAAAKAVRNHMKITERDVLKLVNHNSASDFISK